MHLSLTLLIYINLMGSKPNYSTLIRTH